MTTRPLHRIVRITLVSAVLALAICSFVAFSSGSAHAMSSRAASTSGTTFARIIPNQNGTTHFQPSAVTVKSGADVRIMNTAPFFVHLRFGGSFLTLFPGKGVTLSHLTQSLLVIVSAPHSGALPITVV